METLLAVEGVTKSYRAGGETIRVLDGAALALGRGERVALTGESGSGKSTLLHLIAGLDTADAGSIRIGRLELAGLGDPARARLRRERLGLIFQQFNLIPSLTVAENLGFLARLAGRRDPAWEALLAERLGLAPLMARYPEALSGGQQQRVAIGRAFAARPDLILADEPTGNLDEATADQVVALAGELVAETGAAFLMVTHSERLAIRLDRRLRLAEGRLS